MEDLEYLNNEKDSKFKIANLIEYNKKAEADAITDYNNFLAELDKSDLSSDKKETIQSKIYEIIGDELNHQEVLKMLYTLVTGIKEKEE